MGTEAEHAVLLTNYLTGLGRTTYLVLGRGVPEGKTAYCLTIEVGCFFHLRSILHLKQESGEQWLWNAVTGEHFSSQETFLPLRCQKQDMKTLPLFCVILFCFIYPN